MASEAMEAASAALLLSLSLTHSLSYRGFLNFVEAAVAAVAASPAASAWSRLAFKGHHK